MDSTTSGKMNILFLPRDNKGCGFYRMLVPANEIKKQDLANVVVNFGWDQKLVDWAHVIVIQRATDLAFYELIEKAQAMGKKVIYEIDDYLNAISPENPSFNYWSPLGDHMGRALRLMQKCDAIQVTTPRLRNEYALYNRRIEAIDNYLDKSLWEHPNWTAQDWTKFYRRKNDGIIRIFWSGAGSHYHDLEMIEQVIVDICKKYPHVHFVMMGYHGQSKTGPNLFQEIPSHDWRQEVAQLEKIDGSDLMNYPSKMKACAGDIGIAPLIETGFNQGKSALKVKEYAALGIPVVATNMKPYSEAVKDGFTGFLASTAKEWYDSLELLIKDQSLREELGRNNYQWHCQNTIDKHIHERVDFYQRVTSFRYRW